MALEPSDQGLDPAAARRAAVLAHNARAWDRLAAGGVPLARPAVDAAFDDPRGWLAGPGSGGGAWLPERLDGLAVLCLAAGGGKHGPLYAAAGGRVTVVDISPAMLELDRRVARERRLDLAIIEGSMDDLSMLPAAAFDIVVHPVSTCYVPDVAGVFRAVARVVRPGGRYVSQHKSPAALQTSLAPAPDGDYRWRHPLALRGPLPPEPPSRLRETGTQEFVHSWEALVGGICRAGFMIEDFCEPDFASRGAPPPAAGSFLHRAAFVPPYLRVLARRRDTGPAPGPRLVVD
jgi:SAM-dependent methyltransferase